MVLRFELFACLLTRKTRIFFEFTIVVLKQMIIYNPVLIYQKLLSFYTFLRQKGEKLEELLDRAGCILLSVETFLSSAKNLRPNKYVAGFHFLRERQPLEKDPRNANSPTAISDEHAM